MDYNKWGSTHIYNDFKNAIVYKSNREYHISIFDNYNLIDIKIDNKIILSFKDIKLDVNDLTYFKREFKNQCFIFEKGEIKLKIFYKKKN
jgi:hypothetical protein